jgi:hypothetical protein
MENDMKDTLTVSHFSAGVSSAVATKLAINEINRIFYTHIDDQHDDTLRFVADCQAWFGLPVEHWQHDTYKDVETCCRSVGFVRSPAGAPCTARLKRRLRKKFEREHSGHLRCVWGLDATEIDRAERIEDAMPHCEHWFPLIEQGIDKEGAHMILKASGIRRPVMYDLGYHNNNCIGCLKGGMGYWNKIRRDFPDVFAARSKMERDIGYPILGKRNGWLDELDPDAGRHAGPIVGDCGIMCELMAIEPSTQRLTADDAETLFSANESTKGE